MRVFDCSKRTRGPDRDTDIRESLQQAAVVLNDVRVVTGDGTDVPIRVSRGQIAESLDSVSDLVVSFDVIDKGHTLHFQVLHVGTTAHE